MWGGTAPGLRANIQPRFHPLCGGTCFGTGRWTQFWEQVVFYKGHSRREMGSQKSACACQAGL